MVRIRFYNALHMYLLALAHVWPRMHDASPSSDICVKGLEPTCVIHCALPVTSKWSRMTASFRYLNFSDKISGRRRQYARHIYRLKSTSLLRQDILQYTELPRLVAGDGGILVNVVISIFSRPPRASWSTFDMTCSYRHHTIVDT